MSARVERVIPNALIWEQGTSNSALGTTRSTPVRYRANFS